MSSVLDSVRPRAAAGYAKPHVRIGNIEPAAVALLRQLDPLIVVITLFACILAYHQPLTDRTTGVAPVSYTHLTLPTNREV